LASARSAVDDAAGAAGATSADALDARRLRATILRAILMP
jgi:hypothetical protein